MINHKFLTQNFSGLSLQNSLVFTKLTPTIKLLALVFLFVVLPGCTRPFPGTNNNENTTTTAVATTTNIQASPIATTEPIVIQMGTAVPPYNGTPTPDAPHPVGSISGAATTHAVTEGETLGTIALDYDTTVDELVLLNGIEDSDFVYAGQVLNVPTTAEENRLTPNFKIIPDSELVYGPAAKDFDVRAFTTALDGYLLTYTEEVEGQIIDGPAIVQLVADRYSINPRLLLTAIERHSGWVTQKNVANTIYPLGKQDSEREGLYLQLNWAANLINFGYYGRSEGGLTTMFTNDGTEVAFDGDINHGTAGLQLYLGAVDGNTYSRWQAEVGADGFVQTYFRLFGNPFAYSVDPLIPADLTQPPFALPWPVGESWHYSGGPHAAWNTGSSWAAVDFVPPGTQSGCYLAEDWVTSMTDGEVTRSGFGAVVVDLDGDGYAGTGWALTYMHLDNRDRIGVGTAVQTGDQLGHPGCEGGVSNGTHLHIARSYNGRWIAADGALPIVMAGWVSQGAGYEYNGWLTKNGISVEADAVRSTENAIMAGQ